MSVELILYHAAVLLVGVVLGTFVVAIFPLKSNAQSLARNIYLQAAALLFGVGLALYYTLGHIETNYVVYTGDEVSEELVQLNVFLHRINIPIDELQSLLVSYKKEEVM